MTNSLQHRGAITLVVVFLLGAAAARPAQAQTFTTLHSFEGDDGGYPYAAVIRDEVGNLYGTTSGDFGDDGNYGVVFKVDTAGNETVVHGFSGGYDGDFPYSPLIRGQKRQPLRYQSVGTVRHSRHRVQDR